MKTAIIALCFAHVTWTQPADPGPAASTDVPAASESGDPPDSVDLEGVFRVLRERSPRVAAIQSEIAIAEAEYRAAKVLPNPTIGLAILYLHAGYNQNGVGTYYANVSIPMLLAGQRRARMRTARAGVRATDGQVRFQQHELAKTVRSLFVELQADQERVKTLDNALDEFKEVARLVSGRQGSGLESKYDIARVSVEITAWKARREAAQAELYGTAGELGVAVGVPGWHPVPVGRFGPLALSTDTSRAWPEIERSQPAIEASRREEAYARRGIEQAKREAWPVPTLTVGSVVIQNYYSISSTVGLTVPLPIFDWGQGALGRARAERRTAQLVHDAVIAETRGELERAGRELAKRYEAVAEFETSTVSALPELRTMSHDAFLGGAAELIDLLDATRARFEVELTRIEMTEALMQAEVDYLASAGRVEETSAR